MGINEPTSMTTWMLITVSTSVQSYHAVHMKSARLTLIFLLYIGENRTNLPPRKKKVASRPQHWHRAAMRESCERKGIFWGDHHEHSEPNPGCEVPGNDTWGLGEAAQLGLGDQENSEGEKKVEKGRDRIE